MGSSSWCARAAGLLVVVFSCLVLLLPSAASRQVDGTALNEPYLAGALAWRGGAGAIDWAPGDPSEAVGGHGQARPNDYAEDDVFRSAPLPGAVYVNASEQIHLDLFLRIEVDATGSNQGRCNSDTATNDRAQTWIDVVLLADGRRLAGSNGGQYFVQRTGTPAPDQPPGFQLCRYRFGSEMELLPKGTVLELRIVYQDPKRGPYHFGTSGEAQSVLRIPYYAGEEVFYRTPQGGAAPGPSAPVSLLETVKRLAGVPMAGMAVAGLAITARRRGAGRAALLVLVLASAAFSGCFGHKASGGGVPTPGARTVEATQADPGDTGLANATHGSILGTVVDPAHVPVGSAFVALLGTPNSTMTDRYGHFSFKGLLPGTYRLHVDHAGFVGFDAMVPVVAGKIATLQIELEAQGAFDPSTRPHRHDAWGDKRELVVYDGPWNDNQLFSLPALDSDEVDVVVPGTAMVELNISWDPTYYTAPGRLDLGIQTNADDFGNWTEYGLRGPGEPFRIATNWEMAESGHQAFSSWVLQTAPSPWARDLNYVEVKYNPSGPVPMHATITLHRGVLPLEPPHPDHWHGADSLLVDWEKPVANSPSNCLLDVASKQHFLTLNIGPPRNVVPTGAQWLDVTANLTGPPADGFLWELRYKTGDTPIPRGTDPSTLTAPPPVSTTGLHYVWRVPVAANQTDDTYTTRSSWLFFLAPSDAAGACTAAAKAGFQVTELVDWRLTAAKDAAER